MQVLVTQSIRERQVYESPKKLTPDEECISRSITEVSVVMLC
jgi:hypothetical protein